MSVNMNVMRTCAAPDRRSSAARRARSAAAASTDAPSRRNSSRAARSSRSASSSSSSSRSADRQDGPGARDLVRRPDLAPALDRRSKRLAGGGAVAFRKEDATRARTGARPPGQAPVLSGIRAPSSSTAARASETSPAATAISTCAGNSRLRVQRSQSVSATAALIAA